MGKLPAEGLPPVVDIPTEAFVACRSVRAVPRVDHATRLWGISLLDWQTKPCKRSAKSAGTEYVDLAFRELTFVPLYCTSWLLRREADGPLNVFEASTGLLPLLTGREPPFEEALD